MPAAAKEKTEEGAAAFGEYYFHQFGEATRTGDTSVIEKLALDVCRVCSDGAEEIQVDTEKGWTRSENPYSVSNVVASQRPDEGYKVTMDVKVSAHQRLDKSGKPNGEIKATKYTMTQHIVWAGGHWMMSDWVAT